MKSFFKKIWSFLLPPKYSIAVWEGGSVFISDLPKSDAAGIELLNDSVTPMEFVIVLLARSLNLSNKEATEGTLRIHFKGAAKFGRMEHIVANDLADHIRREVEKADYPLRCNVCEGQSSLAPEPLTKQDVLDSAQAS